MERERILHSEWSMKLDIHLEGEISREKLKDFAQYIISFIRDFHLARKAKDIFQNGWKSILGLVMMKKIYMTMMKKMMTINNSAERENSHGAIVL